VHVPNIETTLDRIAKQGGSALMPKMEVPGQSIYIAMFKDPAGNPIGLIEEKK
jgi:predicted enzyme related to lactoylglutathione lyase